MHKKKASIYRDFLFNLYFKIHIQRPVSLFKKEIYPAIKCKVCYHVHYYMAKVIKYLNKQNC